MSATTTVEARTVTDRSDPLFTVDNLLGVTCTSPVTRGTRSTCTASVSPATSFTVTSWNFTGDSHNVVMDSANSSATWELLPPVSGTVSVEALVGGRYQVATTRITVTGCDLLDSVPADTLLLNPVVQATLIDLAHRTHWDGPVEDWREHGGYFVEHDGAVEFHEYHYRAGMPTACNSDHEDETAVYSTSGYHLLAEGHTHPTSGEPIDNTSGVCPTKPRRELGSHDGPSIGTPGQPQDLTPWQTTNPYRHPGIVVGPHHLHWWKNIADASGNLTLDQAMYNLSEGENRCIH